MKSMMVWCVSWYTKHGERRIEWNVPDPYFLRDRLIEDGIDEIDLIRSGLDDMMIDGFQEVKKEFLKMKKPDFRTAAYKVAIEKIAMSYDSIGL